MSPVLLPLLLVAFAQEPSPRPEAAPRDEQAARDDGADAAVPSAGPRTTRSARTRRRRRRRRSRRSRPSSPGTSCASARRCSSTRSPPGFMPLKNEAGRDRGATSSSWPTWPTARAAREKRPLMFSFNGGPGSSSVWLHLGALGPEAREDARRRRPAGAALRARGQRAHLARVHRPRLHRPRRHRLQPRREAGPGQEVLGRAGRHRVGGRVHPPLPDALRALGLAALPGRRELRHHARGRACRATWSTRASRSTASCSSRRSSTSRPRASPRATTCRIALFLPTYTATAWYHKQLPADLQAKPLQRGPGRGRALGGERVPGRLWRKGDAPDAPPSARRSIERLARYTGLDPEYLDDDRPAHRDPALLQGAAARREAHRGPPGQPLQGHGPAGRRASGPTSTRAWPPSARPTPRCSTTTCAATSGYKSDLHVLHPGRRHRRPGTGAPAGSGFADTSEALRSAFAKNPHMKLFVASGYYDLATPYFATEYTLRHLGLDPSLRDERQHRRTTRPAT